jgi:hypothetical protein
MISYLAGSLFGAIAICIVGFLVWRNNKEEFIGALEMADRALNVIIDVAKSAISKIKAQS